MSTRLRLSVGGTKVVSTHLAFYQVGLLLLHLVTASLYSCRFFPFKLRANDRQSHAAIKPICSLKLSLYHQGRFLLFLPPHHVTFIRQT